ncbi:Thiol:disulfide interchange protein DsbD precursor [Leclercia adecarboxylata]|uniref:Thiol:disulfide interchange protein DsbD n=1 Tax=Leclercia adecarboxylata TaxID=83655 RepID=A0A4U9HI06_9ENTR|nr:Thiol:disulfide interchange protein DsbD precursor [Leclercia adecarboxylata]
MTSGACGCGPCWASPSFSWAFISSLNARTPWIRLVQILLLAAALVSVRPLQDLGLRCAYCAKARRT